MAKKVFPPDVIKQAQELLSGWNQITPVPTYGTLTTASLAADLTTATAIEAQITTLEAQLTDKRAQRDTTLTSLWDKAKRAKSYIKGNFGDDSTQYKLVGGTPISEKKPRARKGTKS